MPHGSYKISNSFTSSDSIPEKSVLVRFHEEIKEARQREKDAGDPRLSRIRQLYSDLIRAAGESSGSPSSPSPLSSVVNGSGKRDFGRISLYVLDDDKYISLSITSSGVPTRGKGGRRSRVRETIPPEEAFTGTHVIVTSRDFETLASLGVIDTIGSDGKPITQVLGVPPDIFASSMPGVVETATALMEVADVIFDERTQKSRFITLQEEPYLSDFIGVNDSYVGKNTEVYAGPEVSEEAADDAFGAYVGAWVSDLFEKSFLKFTGKSAVLTSTFIESIINFFLDDHMTITLPENIEINSAAMGSMFAGNRLRCYVAYESLPESHRKAMDALIHAMDVLRLWFVCSMDCNKALLFDGDLFEDDDPQMLIELLKSFRNEIGVEIYEQAYWDAGISVSDLLIGKKPLTSR